MPSNLLKFEPALLKRLLVASEQEQLRAIVWMREQAQLQETPWATMDDQARKQAVVNRLQSTADRTQHKVRDLLSKAQAEGRVASYKTLWIVNGIALETRQDVLWELAAHPDVGRITEDRVQHLPEPRDFQELTTQQLDSLQDAHWNIERIQANRVWEILGITGEGVVVANIDSGVDWQHPQLLTRYRGYTGKPIAVHEGNWYCATDEGFLYPGDGMGHGTHVMGIMVGQNGIGVAPGARWIAVKAFNSQGLAYNSWIHDSFQWILAPGGDPSLAPDVVNNSWGNSNGSDQEFLADVQALRAAGIVAVFAAGNDGPGSGTVGAPGSYRESFAIGATDSSDQIARFSSRGPSPWGDLKPQMSAPGVGILSTLPGGALGTQSGTSMATPHVSGLVALMRSANPLLTVEETEQILLQTALPLGEEHPNNTYGWGLTNAYAAVTQAGNLGRLIGRVTDANSEEPIVQAVVQATLHGSTVTATATTNAEGLYALGLSDGRYDVTLASFGHHSHTEYGVQVTMGGTTTLDAALTPLPTGILRGTVREAGTGAPLQAAVYVPGTPATTTSKTSSGAYTLTLPAGVHTVRVESTAHRFATATVTIPVGETRYQNLTLEPAPTILLVDSGAWYNDSQRSYYERALEDARFLYDRHIITDPDPALGNVPTADELRPYDLVIWTAPQDAPGYIGASFAITSYLSGGGRLFLSGQDIAFWDGGGSGVSFAPYFQQYLKARFIQDDAPTRVLDGQGALFAGRTITIAGAGGADNQSFPDVVASADRDYAAPAWAYRQDGSGGQTVGPCLPYRAIYLSFGLEAVNDGTARSQILEHSIDWLVAPLQPAGVDLQSGQAFQIAPPGGQITYTVRLRNSGEVVTDTYTLSLASATWPATLQTPANVSVGACQPATVEVSVHIPPETGWHISDTVILTARSALSPGITSAVSLTSKTPAPLLLVDGARFFHMESRYQAALDESGIPYDYQRVKGTWPLAIPTTQTLALYPVVVWYTSYDWYMPLSEEEGSRLMAYLDGGGRLFLSSQDYLYYGYGGPLAREYLGVLGFAESVTPTVASGQAKHPIGWGAGPYTLTYPYNNWSDALIPTLDSEVAFRDQQDLPIGLTHRGDGWRTSFHAFPFETLDPDAARTVMARTVGWLSWLGETSWQADRRTVAGGEQVSMTCVLSNDGWADISSAHLAVALPDELSLIEGSLAPQATYDPLARTVTWHGSLAQDERVYIGFRTQVADSLADSTYITLPAQISYDDHSIQFERPYILRANAPDLSHSTLSVEPAVTPPEQILTYTLALRNTGVRDATATVTIAPPAHTILTGTLESGGVGHSQVISDILLWTGPVAAQDEIALRYHLALDAAGDYLLVHDVEVADQHGERWLIEARASVRYWKLFMPQVAK